MRLRVRLIDDQTGAEVASAVVANMYAVTGQDELVGFGAAGVAAFEVTRRSKGYTVNLGDRQVNVSTYAAIPMPGGTLHCTILRETTATFGRGRCPRCGAQLRSVVQGGAYRAAATTQRHCGACEVEVLTLADASALGTPTGVGNGWLQVLSPLSCPNCGVSMVPVTLSLNSRQVGVEACGACNLVVVEPEDRVALLV